MKAELHGVVVEHEAAVVRQMCYLRLMFLKFRYRLGYESLCAEVGDSISWRRFCRIGLDGRVPHPTTL